MTQTIHPKTKAKKEPTLKALDMLIADQTKQREELALQLEGSRSTIEKLESWVADRDATIKDKEAQILQLTKERDQEKSYKDLYSKKQDEAERKVEAIHSLLDGLPNTGERTSEVKNTYGSCSTKEVCPLARLGMFLGHLAVTK